MPPSVALAATIAFCSFMVWRDTQKQPGVSSAVWLPVLWIFFVGSKFLGQWLQLFGVPVSAGSYEDGSVIDALFFLLLIGSGIGVLVQRQCSLSLFVRNNVWLSIFLVYCFIAITWSDFPFVAFKRWVKILGHPVMALIIMTEGSPIDALRAVLKRCAYVMIPLSILFIKYFPELGRYFDSWTGAAMNKGIAHNKNELGYGCMVFGLFFVWNLVYSQTLLSSRARRQELVLSIAFISMISWLFYMANSATAVTCTLIGVTTIALVRMRVVSPRFVGTCLVAGILAAVLAEITVGVSEPVLQLLGRNPTLTDRTLLWADLIAMDINPVLGAGFESFWLGQRLDVLAEKWWWQPNQAHNGYIETYLNLGWIGVFLLAGVLLAVFWKCRLELLRSLEFGSLRLAFLLAIVTYNYTEAAFKGVHLIWTMFFIIAIDYAPIATVASRNHPVRNLSHRGVVRLRTPGRFRLAGGPHSSQHAARFRGQAHPEVVDGTARARAGTLHNHKRRLPSSRVRRS